MWDYNLLSGGNKVVHKLKAVHAEFMCNVLAISRLPVRDISCANHIVLDFACDADHSNFGPVG